MKTVGENIAALLSGGDLRSIGGSNEIMRLIRNQEEFDILFSFLYHNSRLIVMRAVDSIEKISRDHSSYLDKHKSGVLDLIASAADKELKWHLAQLVPRLELNDEEKNSTFERLKKWLMDKTESKIVRVNSIQALYELSRDNKVLTESFDEMLSTVREENIPSINARIGKLNDARNKSEKDRNI